jgi:hypothetical protein
MDQALIEEALKAGGIVTVEVIRDGKNGPEVIERRQMHNLVINVGKRQIMRLTAGLETQFFDQFRIGTSVQAPAVTDTNVLSPIANTRITSQTPTFLSITTGLEWVISYPSGGGSISANGIAEVILQNVHTSGAGISALMRSLITPTVNKTLADKLKITYQLRVT